MVMTWFWRRDSGSIAQDSCPHSGGNLAGTPFFVARHPATSVPRPTVTDQDIPVPTLQQHQRCADDDNVSLTFNAAHRQRTTTDVISPRIDKLLDHVDSDYASVIVAAKRARQINSYYHNLGEGTFDEFPPPMVDTRSKNYLTIALEEVAQGKLKYHYR